MIRTDAERRIAVAGRELGGGVTVAVERIQPGLIDALTERGVAAAERRRAEWEQRLADGVSGAQEVLSTMGTIDVEEIRRRNARYVYGIAVGLVMAQDKDTMDILDEIYWEWRRSSA